jgi:hypothetical protein
MKLFPKTFLSLLTIYLFATAGSSNCTLYLIKPILDSISIGITTDADERAECTELLTLHCRNIFKTTVVAVDRQALNELKEKKVDFLIWDIGHYHFLYDDQEHIPCIQAALYQFSASNNYQMPILAVVPPKVEGEAAYGNMAPFREGIDANFKKLKKMFKKGLYGVPASSQITAETILESDPLRNASSKVYVIVSPLNDSTIGNTPADYELFHLPAMIGHYVGELLNKEPVIISQELLGRIKEQGVDTKVARVDLRHFGDGDNELKLSVYRSTDIETPIFSSSIKDPCKEEWKFNDEFQEGLEAIFKIITQQMGTKSNKK